MLKAKKKGEIPNDLEFLDVESTENNAIWGSLVKPENIFEEKIKPKGLNNKLVIHIGFKTVQLLSCSISGKNIDITGSHSFSTDDFVKSKDLINTIELAQEIKDIVFNRKYVNRGNVILIMPQHFYEDNLVSVADKKEKDLNKYFEQEYYPEQGINLQTSIVDWVYLTDVEDDSQMAKLCLVSSVAKRNIERMVKDLSDSGFTIQYILSTVYSLFNFSRLFETDYSCRDRLIVNVNEHNITNIIIKDNNPINLRDSKNGIGDLVNLLIEHLKISKEVAESLIKEIGVSGNMLAPYLECLGVSTSFDSDILKVKDKKEDKVESDVLSEEELQSLINGLGNNDLNFIEDSNLTDVINNLSENTTTVVSDIDSIKMKCNVNSGLNLDKTILAKLNNAINEYGVDLNTYFSITQGFIDSMIVEIERLIQLCRDTSNTDISKVILANSKLDGLKHELDLGLGLPILDYDLNEQVTAICKGFNVNCNGLTVDSRFNIALGGIIALKN